jgi:hypothetical protein
VLFWHGVWHVQLPFKLLHVCPSGHAPPHVGLEESAQASRHSHPLGVATQRSLESGQVPPQLGKSPQRSKHSQPDDPCWSHMLPKGHLPPHVRSIGSPHKITGSLCLISGLSPKGIPTAVKAGVMEGGGKNTGLAGGGGSIGAGAMSAAGGTLIFASSGSILDELFGLSTSERSLQPKRTIKNQIGNKALKIYVCFFMRFLPIMIHPLIFRVISNRKSNISPIYLQAIMHKFERILRY